MSKNYNFTFTLFGYDAYTWYKDLECGFMAYGEETCPTTQRPHLQGYVHFVTQISHKTACRRMPGARIAVMRGRFDQNETYCSKESSLTKRGECPQFNINNGVNEADRWKHVWECAVDGRMLDIPDKIRIQHYGTFKRIKTDYMSSCENLDPKVPCGVWVYGPSGTGKTTMVDAAYPDNYPKSRDLFWEKYEGQEVVFLDELDRHHAAFVPEFKQWADWKKFQANIKYGGAIIRPKKFIVCSNYHLNQIIPTGDVMYEAIARRFKFFHKTSFEQVFDI